MSLGTQKNTTESVDLQVLHVIVELKECPSRFAGDREWMSGAYQTRHNRFVRRSFNEAALSWIRRALTR
jgi:hypothetical protein